MQGAHKDRTLLVVELKTVELAALVIIIVIVIVAARNKSRWRK